MYFKKCQRGFLVILNDFVERVVSLTQGVRQRVVFGLGERWGFFWDIYEYFIINFMG